ncbi:polysaccharide deacetylase family protein [Aquibium sp. ELW1220]|uniref:polysaccharide deacetylase family protein n=1 Tax=Aquibium sp. ELW1220 TaxID=2976766 RepID=UPI0025B015CF|nr:polysaccharide deacetylase family protein [Aquibium sp. ELW1220]MDN2580815.1 polysaccharide deacetylase family protein [Aquibium sp. ELW1220]
MTVFAAVEDELALWDAAGLAPRFWLRDDDAVEPTPALERLIGFARRRNAPVLLAVVPARVTQALADRLADEPLVRPCQHGISHRNNAAEGMPSLELGGAQPAEDVLAELAQGRARLLGLFGDRLSGILVPPWNRMAPEVAARLEEIGFSGLSTWSWQRKGTSLPELNTQIDVMDWAGGQRGRDLAWTAGELLRRLVQAREKGGAPLGILTHHLVHDERAWSTLDELVAWLADERGFAFESAEALIAAGAAMQG